MDTEGFRDRADEALTQGEEEVDERTGGRFDEQTDRAADEVRERGEGVLGDQQADEPQQSAEEQAADLERPPSPRRRPRTRPCNEPRGRHGGGQDGPARRLTTLR
jgi:MT0933-like antitoxin protein